jgi:hypothetical protein
MGFGRGFKQLRGLLGGVGGAAAIGWARGKVEEGGRLENLAKQTGVSAELLQRAELAQKLYGDEIFRSTKALKEALDTIKNVPVQSNRVISKLSNEAKEWTKLGAEAKSVGGGVAAAGSSGVRGVIDRITPLMLLRTGLAAFGSKPTTPSEAELAAAAAALGGGKPPPGAKTKLENLPGIKPPTGDALQRIGLFVGGVPIGMDNSKVQRDQLRALQRIESNTRRTYENL